MSTAGSGTRLALGWQWAGTGLLLGCHWAGNAGRGKCARMCVREGDGLWVSKSDGL